MDYPKLRYSHLDFNIWKSTSLIKDPTLGTLIETSKREVRRNLSISHNLCKQIDQKLGRFILRGHITMGRLKMEQLCHPVKKGGLGLFNTERKAKALNSLVNKSVMDRGHRMTLNAAGGVTEYGKCLETGKRQNPQ